MPGIKGTFRELIAWNVLNMWTSHLGLPLLIGTVVLSKRVQRHAVFVSMCVVWVLAGLFSSILLYTGHLRDPAPPQMLCLLQASLLYGVPPATSLATFMLVYQMFIALRSGIRTGEAPVSRPWKTWLMVVAPYVAYIAAALLTAVVGASYPKLISRRRFFYCSVKSDALTNALVIFAMAYLPITLIFEVWTILLLYKRWKYLRQKGTDVKSPIDLAFAARILAFAAYLLLDLSLAAISIQAPSSSVPDLAFATNASIVVLIFGSQRDIRRAWCFWKKEKPSVVGEQEQPDEAAKH